MNVAEAIDYINAHTWSQWKLGLSRTQDLLRLLGDPQKRLRFVHVAGSNGKGSTCAMVERILREAGYVTGFYPSPYIEDFRERIQVCGEYITEEALCRITARVRDAADSMEDHPSQFEIITAIGMVYFAEKNCDLVVLEVGLGGTFDSTNIIDAPEVAVITNIGLEHTEYLGDTLAEIAGNKCGIIKSGADVVCYENVPEVMEVVRRTCGDKGCPLHIARFDRIRPVERSFAGQTFRFLPDGDTYCLALPGEYQLHNAATALTVVEALRGRGWRIPKEAVERGLANVEWPARFEILSGKRPGQPVFILDGGHNPQCAEALARSLREYLPAECAGEAASPEAALECTEGVDSPESAPDDSGQKVVFLMGMLADKDYEQVIRILSPFAAGFVCLTPDSPRALPADQLAGLLQSRGFTARACADAEEGIRAALQMAIEKKCAPAASSLIRAFAGLPVVAFGSLYMAGAVRHAFPSVLKACIASWKADQRAEALRRRRALTVQEREAKSRAVCGRLAGLSVLHQAKTVFTYAASWDEVNLDELNRTMAEQGKTVCYPISKKNGVMTAVVPGTRTAQTASEGTDTRIARAASGGRDAHAAQTAFEGTDAHTAWTAPEEPDMNTARTASVEPDAENAGIWRTGVFGIREPVENLAQPVDPDVIDAVLVPCVVFDRRGGRCGHGAGYYDRFLAQLSPDVPKILVAFDAQEAEEVAVEATDIPMDWIVTETSLLRN